MVWMTMGGGRWGGGGTVLTRISPWALKWRSRRKEERERVDRQEGHRWVWKSVWGSKGQQWQETRTEQDFWKKTAAGESSCSAATAAWHNESTVASEWTSYLIGRGSLLGGVSSSSLLSTAGDTFRKKKHKIFMFLWHHCQVKTPLNNIIISFTISAGRIDLHLCSLFLTCDLIACKRLSFILAGYFCLKTWKEKCPLRAQMAILKFLVFRQLVTK